MGGSCGPTGSTIAPAVKQVFWGFPPFLALVETIALAVHFQDMDMVGEAVQQSPGQAFRAEYLRPLIERQVGGHQDRAPLVALAEDFEQQLGAGLRERHEAEFVDDQKVILCQLLLQAQQAFFIPGLHQFMNQGSGREEADGEPLLAGRQTETEGDMGLAGSAVAERDDILTTLDVFASRQLQNQHLVERCDGLEVEAVEAFDGGEPGLSDPPLDHAALTVDQFQLGQTDKIPHMVGALGGALAGQLVVFAQERPAVSGS